MIRLGILYLLPFILIFILFERQSVKYNQKSGLKILLALALFFGFQFLSAFIASFLILKYSSAENPKQILVDNILLINISSSTLGIIATSAYYKYLENKIKADNSEKNKEIDHLGEK